MESNYYELTNPQKNIWNTEMYYSNTNVNNICASSIFGDDVNIDLLKQAINILVQKHDSFRIKLTLKNSVPMQCFEDFVPFDIDVKNIKDMDEFQSLEEEIVSEQFKLIDSPLYKFVIIKFDNGKVGVILNVHHMIGDSWSMGYTVQEIIKLYNLLKNKESLDDEIYSYKDFIASEQKYAESNRFNSDKDFWESNLKNLPNPVTLPSLSSASSNESSAAERASFTIDKNIMNSINAFCSENKISTYIFFMSIFSIYLGNLCNTDDVLLGTPIINRLNFREKQTTGMFVTTIPFRIQLTDGSFIDFAQKNNISLMSTLRHQKYSYSDIIEDVRKENPDMQNLYNVALSYQITKADKDKFGEYEGNWTFNHNCLNDINIHLMDFNETGNLDVNYDYLTSKYSASDIENHHERIMAIINQVISNPEMLVKDVEVITEKEKFEILKIFNDRKLKAPLDSNVIALFEKQVEEHPETAAVTYKNVTLTYGELNTKVNQFARFLQTKGIQKGDIVGVYMNKTEWFIVSILALQKLGAAYAPMHPEYPLERVSYILEDCKSKILITDKENVELPYPQFNPQNVDTSSFDSSNLNIDISSDNLCYVIYTSGSTGKPKGVLLTHKNLINFLYVFYDSFDSHFSVEDNCLSVANMAFDASVQEIYSPLCFGATLVIYPLNTLTDIPVFTDILEKNHITFSFLPPNILDDIVDFIIENHKNFYINKLSVGVEAIKNGTLNKYYKLNPNIEIINGYGPSEATICSTFFKYVYNPNESEIVPIGYPLKNNNLYILNKFNNLLPINTPGELCISGASVSKGYLNNPEKTKLSFEKINKLDGQIFYRTGDNGYWSPKGYINFIGRQDSQVKFRGHRIELTEINNNIRNLSGVTNSITQLKDVNGILSLCSYVEGSKDLNENAIKLKLSKILPYYMIPNHIICMAKLPVTVSGKIDKKSLPEIKLQNNIYVAPTTKTEKYIAEKVGNLLNINKLSIDSDFFNIGLDSLSAIKLSVEIYNDLSININIKNIYENNNIYKLAKFIDTASTIDDKIVIKKSDIMEYYPLSSAQKRIYYASKMIGDNNLVYNLSGAVLINEKINKNIIEKYFNKVIENQSSFRTSFLIHNDEVVQHVADNVDFHVDTFTGKFHNMKKIINDFSEPFDLEQAPLLRVSLCYFENNKTLLLIDSHHIIMDGSSFEILLDNLNTLFNNKTLPVNEIEYKDFAVWERSYLQSNVALDDKNYWLSRFGNKDIPTINLPYDFPTPSIRSYKGNSISKKIGEKDFLKYINFAKELSVSPYMFFLSAFIILLYKYSGQNEIIVGSPTAGRNNVQLKNIIGMFVNDLVFDSTIDSNETYLEFIEKTKNNLLNDLTHADYPFDMLVKDLNLSVDNSKNPLFDVMFSFQDFEKNATSSNMKIMHAKSDTAKFNLIIDINSNTKIANIEYCCDLFKESTIENLFTHYLNTLDSIIENKNKLIKDIHIISDSERNIIINKFNETKLSYPKRNNLVELFSKVASKYANSTAVSYNDMSITYRELDQKSNDLADKLRDSGINQGDAVGVCLNKSIELIISIWAILKAGAIYIPMYIDYPDDRLDYMLSNSNAKLLITNSTIDNIHKFNISKIELNNYMDLQNLKRTQCDFNYSNEHVAYIIYTSGSTGKPKGVQISHKNLINFVYSFKKLFQNDISNKDNFLSSTNISFDVSIFEIFLPLLSGANLVLYTEEIIKDILTYCDCIINNNITGLYIPPNILNEVYNILKDSTNLNIDKLLVGVEAIRKSTLNKYLKLNPDMKIVNGYGPTETTICCSALQYSYDDDNDDIVSIGKPLNNDQIYILDKDYNIQPIGITGNLYVSGDGVGVGYINNPTETSKNYLNNFINSNSKYLYNTGDLAKWNSDGTINFIGRNDSQVKISGHRIELKEINYQIMQYPNITKAYTMIVKKASHSFIASYFIAENDIQVKDLLDFLKSKLASFMVPNYIKQLDSFPLTVNGKIDKTKLPEISVENKEYVAPRNDFEKKVIKIWKKLFLLDKIGIDDNFFELGGDSLTAIKFQIEAMNVGLNISYSDIFSHQTPRELSDINAENNEEIIYNISKDYDYSKINKLESNNILDNLYSQEDTIKENINKKYNYNALLIGGTGYLGAHLLDSFLTNNSGKVYCLIRKKSLLDPEERLRKTLNFYFDNKYDNEFGNRIIVINGDITNKELSLNNDQLNNLANNIDVVIHSAALVKHYGSFEQFNDINVTGTQNIIDFCKKYNKKLYYVSTLSISGLGNSKKTVTYFKEKDFYINQNLNNVYLYTKFEAEKIIYENILNSNLKACVLRVGNITNRYSDGKFQINASENAFVNRIKSILKLGVVQDKFLEHSLEFTPVDVCSDAIIKIVNSNPSFTTFHLFNTQLIRFDTLLANLNSIDINIKPVSDKEFAKTVTRFLNSENLRNEISGIITDLDKNKLLSLTITTLPTCEFTQTYLKLLGFEWPKIDINYIKKYVKYFNSIKYFE